MVTYNYYPGCTLSTKAKALDAAARSAAEVLGFSLAELPEWECCGAVYPMAPDAIAERLGAVRALASARDRGGVLVTLCSACYHVLKRVNNDMKNNPELRAKVNAYLELEVPYAGETRVLHYLEVLRDEIGFAEVKRHVTNPLKGQRIGSYYGCMLLRPGKVMGLDNPESPVILEDFVKALGAAPVDFNMKNECCAGYVSLTNKDYTRLIVGEIQRDAKDRGAETLITACPLCAYNLTKNGPEAALPVKYFTELLAEALGLQQAGGAE